MDRDANGAVKALAMARGEMRRISTSTVSPWNGPIRRSNSTIVDFRKPKKVALNSGDEGGWGATTMDEVLRVHARRKGPAPPRVVEKSALAAQTLR